MQTVHGVIVDLYTGLGWKWFVREKGWRWGGPDRPGVEYWDGQRWREVAAANGLSAAVELSLRLDAMLQES